MGTTGQFQHLCPEINPVTKFTIFTIFCYTHAKIAEFTILTIFCYCSLQILQFFALCYVSKNKSATGCCGFYKVCENCGFYTFNKCNDFSLLCFVNFTIFSPFVMLITTHQQRGSAVFTKFAKIADFAN